MKRSIREARAGISELISTLASVLVLALALMSAFAVFAGNVSAGTVNPDGDDQKFAYGEAVKWVNFEPGRGPGVTVTKTNATGYAWCETAGWINLSPSGYDGVVHDGNGNLSGWAWGESAGWISFSCKNNGDTCGDVDYGVRIDLSNGVFEGYAWSEVVGWINFNLASTSYSAYAAKTSWPHAISGNADVGGVELSYNDGGVKTATADANGEYSFTVPYGWSGTVTPSKTGYDFDPAGKNYTEVKTDQTGQDYTATLTNAAPEATTQAASSEGETTAMLNGVVVPNGLATSAWFEWGIDDQYGNRLPELPNPGYDAGSNGSAQIADLLAGLTAATFYHYRAVAQNSAGIGYGDDQTFTTGDIDSSCDDHWPIKIEDGFEYEFLFDAIATAQDGDTILLSRTPVDEEVNIELENATILLEGGWSCDFGSMTDTVSMILGSLTVTSGTLIVHGVVVTATVEAH